MDQILSAVLAVLPALAAETATSAVKDAYSAFKSIVLRKWGEKGAVTQSLDALEHDPHSEERVSDLKRSLAASAVNEDQEVMAAIKGLLEAQAHVLASAGSSNAKYEQTGGEMSGVGAIGTNSGTINLNRS